MILQVVCQLGWVCLPCPIMPELLYYISGNALSPSPPISPQNKQQAISIHARTVLTVCTYIHLHLLVIWIYLIHLILISSLYIWKFTWSQSNYICLERLIINKLKLLTLTILCSQLFGKSAVTQGVHADGFWRLSNSGPPLPGWSQGNWNSCQETSLPSWELTYLTFWKRKTIFPLCLGKRIC